jgi:Domain of unknown function (DUF4868)
MTVANSGKNTKAQQFNASTLLKEILAQDLKQCKISVCLASTRPNSDVPGFRRINLAPEMGDEFRKAINSALEPFKKGTLENNIALHDFAADTVSPENEIEYLDISDYDKAISDQIAPLADYDGMHHFEHDDKPFIKNMRFYVLIVEPAKGSPIYFYRKYSHTQLLQESTQFGMHLLHKDVYDVVKDPTFLFDRHLDCISYDKHMFILQKSNFYSIFDFTDALKEVAERTLDGLRVKDFIHNFDRFARDCMGNKIKLLKLKNISMQSYLSTISIDDLERTINNYDSIDIEMKKINGKKKLMYDAKKPWEILHLLDDTYLDSGMTSASYHAKGKRGVRKK